MRRLIAAVMVTATVALMGCATPKGTVSRPAPEKQWTSVALAKGEMTVTRERWVSNSNGDAVTLTAGPARLVIIATQVYGNGTRLYLVPTGWIDSQAVNASDFTSYPDEFLSASADSTGTSVVDVPHVAGSYVLVPVGGAADGSGATFTASLEQAD